MLRILMRFALLLTVWGSIAVALILYQNPRILQAWVAMVVLLLMTAAYWDFVVGDEKRK